MFSVRLGQQKLPVVIKSHWKSKRISMRLGSGEIKITKPKWVPNSSVKEFISKNLGWIEKQFKSEISKPKLGANSKTHMTSLRIRARRLIKKRLEFFNRHYGYDYSRVSIRDQSTRWGSCSSRGTLSFNYRLAMLPERLVDYVVVHELCHLKEMNHSSRFWGLVAETMPNYRILRRELKGYRI